MPWSEAYVGDWMDRDMPSLDDIEVPYWGYWASGPVNVRTETEALDMPVKTGLVIEWELTDGHADLWFAESDEIRLAVHDSLVSWDWTQRTFHLQAYVRSGVADIYPESTILRNVRIAIADYIEIVDFARVEEAIQFKTHVTVFEDGSEQRRTKGRGRRVWQVSFRKGSPYAEAMVQSFLERMGTQDTFLWRNPIDGRRYTVRFAGPLPRTVRWGAQNEFRVGLVEVL